MRGGDRRERQADGRNFSTLRWLARIGAGRREVNEVGGHDCRRGRQSACAAALAPGFEFVGLRLIGAARVFALGGCR